ncbi:DNA repair protein XRCC4-like isoform X2 [Acipenser ruthenus]|uniref:DNA repair protein XRCC4-like isoform X2 n=1 Tax=Acipenser ruthenus TaxID=7906 RepID=UPI0027406407|nr:DNA repair protein XRCC4-like isoform X2 [Acipenser ruthenus]
MDTSVRRIEVSSEPGKIYFLRVTWEEDLGSGFSVDLCDGQSAWTGKVSEEEVSKEAQEMEMKRQIYVDELCQALTAGGKQTNSYSFDLSKDPADNRSLHFSYEKVLKDVFFKLGSVELHTVSKPIEVIKELINHGLDRSTELRARNEHLLGENERLGQERDYVTEELKKYVQAKEVLEQDLYTRFVLVLNEKKAKIRSLQEKLKQAQEEVESELQHRGDTSTVESKAPAEQDYEGSTDEENTENDENPRPSTSARGRAPPSRNQAAAVSHQRNVQPQPGAPQTQKTSLMTSSPSFFIIIKYSPSFIVRVCLFFLQNITKCPFNMIIL